jgi:hypothetical protein
VSNTLDVNTGSMKELAERLLAIEGLRHPDIRTHADNAAQVFEKLRVTLIRFAGAEGFTALMRRALNLTKAEFPVFEGVTVGTDGSIQGLRVVSASTPGEAAKATTALTSHLLELLVAFIGEPLTLRLVSDAWPDSSISN